MKFISNGPFKNNAELVQILTLQQIGNKPLSQPMVFYWRIYASLSLNELMTMVP